MYFIYFIYDQLATKFGKLRYLKKCTLKALNKSS